MPAWQRITWVEKETKLGPTNLNRMEAGIDAGYPKFGTRAARPPASDDNHGWTYVATDQAATYISDGVTWHRTGLTAGMVADFPLNAVPIGWAALAGQEVRRDGIYADVFAFLGTTHGAGDNLNTFNLPDFRGRMRVGRDDMTGVPANVVPSATSSTTAGGSERVTITANQSGLRDHQHGLTIAWGGAQGGLQPVLYKSDASGRAGFEGYGTGPPFTGGGNDALESHYNMPPYKPVTTCVKL